MGYRAYLVAKRESERERERESERGGGGRGRCNSIRVFPEKDDPAIADRDTLFNRVSSDSLTAYRISIALSRIFIARLLARGTFSVFAGAFAFPSFPFLLLLFLSQRENAPRAPRARERASEQRCAILSAADPRRRCLVAGALSRFAGRKRAGKREPGERELSYASERVEMMENNGDTARCRGPAYK